MEILARCLILHGEHWRWGKIKPSCEVAANEFYQKVKKADSSIFCQRFCLAKWAVHKAQMMRDDF